MREFDQLYITWRTAVQTNHPYFEGNGLQGLANLMVSPNNFELFRTRRGYALDQFGFPVDSLLPLRMAQRALEKIFVSTMICIRLPVRMCLSVSI